MKKTALASEPKQDRSRASFERVLDAATALLEKNGDFTLAEVSASSKVSIGSIYGRVKSKEDLIHTVQVRVLERAELEQADLVNRIRRRALPLDELIPTIVQELARFLERYAPILRPFMDMAPADPVIAATGKKAYFHSLLDFKLLMLERRSEMGHPEPERATETCFNVVYASLARHLGLGTTTDVAREGDWRRLIDDLGQMALYFLRAGAQAAPRRRKKST